MKNLKDKRLNILILAENEIDSMTVAKMVSSTKINESDLWHELRNGVNIYTILKFIFRRKFAIF